MSAIRQDLDESTSKKELKLVNKSGNRNVSEIIDANEFYLQDPANKNLATLEAELGDFDPESTARLVEPIKPSTPCIALFSQDDNFYRATVIK